MREATITMATSITIMGETMATITLGGSYHTMASTIRVGGTTTDITLITIMVDTLIEMKQPGIEVDHWLIVLEPSAAVS